MLSLPLRTKSATCREGVRGGIDARNDGTIPHLCDAAHRRRSTGRHQCLGEPWTADPQVTVLVGDRIGTTLLAATDGGGVFKSTDGGSSWNTSALKGCK